MVLSEQLSSYIYQKGKTINSFDSMIKAAGNARIVELMGKLYAGGDHVWKWYGYKWYQSFLKDYARKDMKRMQTWFSKIAGRELDLFNNDVVNLDPWDHMGALAVLKKI